MAALLTAILDFLVSIDVEYDFYWLHWIQNGWEPWSRLKNNGFIIIIKEIKAFFHYWPLFVLCSADILAAILDFQVRYTLCIVFDAFIGSGMVKNLYLDTKILTLSALLREI